MHTHANARLRQKGQLRLVPQHLNNIAPWLNWLMEQVLESFGSFPGAVVFIDALD